MRRVKSSPYSLKNKEWQKTTEFPIAKEHIKYLGILIGKTPSTIYTLNFPPIIEKIQKELQGWRNLPISLFGRDDLFRMNSFAKLLYPVQNIPVMITTKDINKLNTAIRQFLWKWQRPRIALAKLWKPKKEGGINLPNIHLYNITYLLRHSIDWISEQSRYTNIPLERDISYPWSVKALLHPPRGCQIH